MSSECRIELVADGGFGLMNTAKKVQTKGEADDLGIYDATKTPGSTGKAAAHVSAPGSSAATASHSDRKRIGSGARASMAAPTAAPNTVWSAAAPRGGRLAATSRAHTRVGRTSAGATSRSDMKRIVSVAWAASAVLTARLSFDSIVEPCCHQTNRAAVWRVFGLPLSRDHRRAGAV